MITDFRLTVFITVARTLSFTRAAATLNISQPAISKHIKELESDFGEPLFNRKGSSISLTQKGQSIIPLVERVLEDYSALSEAISQEARLYEGHLQIGASTTIAQYVLPEILAEFNKKYPLIRLSVINANSDDVIKMLQAKEIEIALIEGDNTNNAIHYTTFTSDEIVLISTNKHSKKIHKEEIKKLPLVIREEGSGTLSVILSALRNMGITRKMLNIKMQLGSSQAILRYVMASKCYAFISILVAREYIKRGELTINETEDVRITRQFRFATLHGHNGHLSNTFQEFCIDHYNQKL